MKDVTVLHLCRVLSIGQTIGNNKNKTKIPRCILMCEPCSAAEVKQLLGSEQPKGFTRVWWEILWRWIGTARGASARWALCLDGPASPSSVASASLLSPLPAASLKSPEHGRTNHNVPVRRNGRESVSRSVQKKVYSYFLENGRLGNEYPFSMITLNVFRLAFPTDILDCGLGVNV